MTAEPSRFAFLIVCILGYFALFFGWISFLRWRRKTKWPFKGSDRLLRGPGESLRRRILDLDEWFVLELAGVAIVALLVSLILGWIAKATGLGGRQTLLAVFGGLFVVALASVWRIGRKWQERSNCFLGWFGERVAAEKLQPLQLQGYRIFHDVPAEGDRKDFNLDHVVVGPTGVTVIEVKTRRKGNARPGQKDHEVVFNGVELEWPWGSDRHGVQQTINEAGWLTKLLFERTEMRIPVKAVLTLPGWFVRETPSQALRVVNPNYLPDAVRGRGEITLTTSQIDLVSRVLDQLCRDVEE